MKLIKKLSILPLLGLSIIANAGGDETQKAQPAQAAAIQLSPAQIKLGKRSFIRCQACHTLGEGQAHLTGPNLYGLFSSTAGEKEGFVYSDALVKSDVKWNEESLKAWLKSPFSFIPGNKMAFAGIANEREMEALLAYLKDKTK